MVRGDHDQKFYPINNVTIPLYLKMVGGCHYEAPLGLRPLHMQQQGTTAMEPRPLKVLWLAHLADVRWWASTQQAWKQEEEHSISCCEGDSSHTVAVPLAMALLELKKKGERIVITSSHLSLSLFLLPFLSTITVKIMHYGFSNIHSAPLHASTPTPPPPTIISLITFPPHTRA